MRFQKISILTPREVIGNCEMKVRVSKTRISRGVRVQTKKLSVEVFSGYFLEPHNGRVCAGR